MASAPKENAERTSSSAQINHLGSCRGRGRRIPSYHGFLRDSHGKLQKRMCGCCQDEPECPVCLVTYLMLGNVAALASVNFL